MLTTALFVPTMEGGMLRLSGRPPNHEHGCFARRTAASRLPGSRPIAVLRRVDR